jgi:putative peptide zinc metalloprotease protein
MTEQTKKIVLPAYLMRRLEAFRIVKGDETSYLLRDKVQGRTYDFDAWQFFILEVLPGCEQFGRLQAAFVDRFDRELTQKDFDEFVGSMVDRKLFDESAGSHPLLARFMRRTYEVQDGKAVPKPAATSAVPAAAAPEPPPPPPAAAALPPDAELPAGVQDALGMDFRTTEGMFNLFDPRPLFRLLMPLAAPLRHLVYAVPVLLIAALLLVYQYSHLVSEDLSKLHFDVTLFQYLLFVFITVRAATTLATGLIGHHYNLAVERVGVTLAFGFLPRWTLKMTGAERLTRLQTMWLHGGTLLVRLLLFAVGVLMWFNARDSNQSFSEFGLLLALGSLAGLVLESGNPLVKSHGYYLLSAFLNEPHLRGKAYAALMNKFRGGVYRAADGNLLALYGFLSATYVVVVILLMARMIGKFVFGEIEIGGTAIVIVLAFVVYALYRNYVALKKFAETYERQLQFDRWRSRTVPVETAETGVKAPRTSFWQRALIVGLVLALFLPYPYEPGGNFTIFPARKQVISTDEPGLVEAVFFKGGETVKQGTVIARLTNEDMRSQIGILNAKIDEQRAVIQNLKTLPRPEEVRLAEQQLAVERTREQFSRDKVPRLKRLQEMGAVSLEEYEAARKEHLTDQEQVAQREAQLSLVKVPITAAQIEAAEARLASLLEEKAAVESKVRRFELRMPFDGNLLTLHLQNKANSYLEKGAPFASVEDTGTVTAEIDLPEADVPYVELGATVRVRAVSFAVEREFEGKVTLIDRNVTVLSTGNVVKVLAAIDNPDGLLRTGMAGRAKVLGETMPVWKAFTMALVRFVQIQVWSWLP